MADALIPEYQPCGGLTFRLAATLPQGLPPITLSIADGPFHFQTYLGPQEARNLADFLYGVADGLACDRCHGNGLVQVNRSPIGDPQADDDVECPACLGTGAPA